uniref:Uncharacterized protein n=1 Tax=Panagrolaimus davidi TaxID=227884 RepID=A0A914QQQ6_9BILA
MPAEIARREDFVTADDGFISVEVLTGPNWSVYSLDKKGALFVEMPKPISSYSIEKCPFIYPHLFEDSIRVAEIDLKTYFKFGDELESDYKPPKCLFFTNTARSASTLFGSMLHHEGHSTVISEHPALSTIAIKFCQGYLSEKVRKNF